MRHGDEFAAYKTVECMVERKSTPAIPGWLPSLLMGLFLAAVARQGARSISDPDVFWHLRLGHDILSARSVTSVTAPWSALSDEPWVPTQWLTEVVLALAEDLGGLSAVSWLFTVGLLALVLLIHRLTRRQADPVPSAFATGLTVAAMAASLSPRPHIVTYLLLGLTLIAWLGSIEDLRPRWWLIPLTWLWAMSHGMWFVGPVVGCAVVLGLILDGRLDRRLAIRLTTIPAASVALATLTPVGPALLGGPFAVAGIGEFITEWQPPSFRSPSPAAAALIVAFVAVAWARSTRRVPWSHIALLVLAVGWILLATRTVALGALIVSPLLAASLQDAVARERVAPTPKETWFLRLAALAIACAAALVVPQTASTPSAVPSGLDAELDALPPSAVVFNAYELGGWLRWRHPDLEPVVDGMTEAYSVQHLRKFGWTQSAAGGWDERFDSWDPKAALVLENSPVATALIDQREWTSVATDGGYVLLIPPS